jgi:hypothetical protein
MHTDSRKWVRAVHWPCATRLISMRGLPKLSSRQEPPAGRIAEIDALHLFCVVRCFGVRQLNQKQTFDRQVVVVHLGAVLLP